MAIVAGRDAVISSAVRNGSHIPADEEEEDDVEVPHVPLVKPPPTARLSTM
jgi:hypothetical protein